MACLPSVMRCCAAACCQLFWAACSHVLASAPARAVHSPCMTSTLRLSCVSILPLLLLAPHAGCTRMACPISSTQSTARAGRGFMALLGLAVHGRMRSCAACSCLLCCARASALHAHGPLTAPLQCAARSVLCFITQRLLQCPSHVQPWQLHLLAWKAMNLVQHCVKNESEG